LTDKKNHTEHNGNQFYQIIDQKTELVNHTLGKILGSGIMPAYPFFILSVISTYETFQIPLEQENYLSGLLLSSLNLSLFKKTRSEK